ncbi:MAG: Fic family protein [Methanobacteriota archaeon]
MVDFAPYRRTPETIVRKAQTRFAPHVEVPRGVHEAIRRIERADEVAKRGALDAATTRRLLVDALSRNAYGTASIEGNPLTLADVTSLLAAGPTPEALERPEEREIINHAGFLETVGGRRFPTEVGEVAALHAELFAGVLPDAGRFKAHANFVGKRPEYVVTYVPTSPERVVSELSNALAWSASSTEHPVVRALLFFHEFQAIHPFRDGNGRVGRALLHLQLHTSGYEGVRFAFVDYLFNEDRDAYYGALQAGDRGDLSAWLSFGAGLLAEAFEDARRRVLLGRDLRGLSDREMHVAEWFARATRRHGDRRLKFADVHAAFPEIAERTLKRDLTKLVDLGVLDREGERKGTTYGFRHGAGERAEATR